mgnify:FL=1|tara:strand:- start:7827 stop:8012 length:186 start_codon:yes stop_codon:yes gene_type:complete
MEKIKLTSVKVSVIQQLNFKKICLENGMNFQKLVNRSLFLYNTDKAFKETINKVEYLDRKF